MLIHYNNIIAYHNNYLYTYNGIIDTNTIGLTIDSSPIGIGSRFKKWCENKGIVLFYVRKQFWSWIFWGWFGQKILEINLVSA